jgi:uncharacterized protein YcnI
MRAARRAAVIFGGCMAAVLALSGVASAHVTITPASARQGSTAELTFRVPNEETRAATTKIQVKIPIAHPIAQFLVRPVPGWHSQVRTVRLANPIRTDDGTFSVAVSEVTWTGGKILPGQYQDFSVSADPLPSGISVLVFKALQTYSNGDVVRWIDTPQPGQPEPEHPAPALVLTKDAGSAQPAADIRPAAAAGGASGGGGDGLELGLAIAGLATGVLALLALAAGRLRRRTAGQP